MEETTKRTPFSNGRYPPPTEGTMKAARSSISKHTKEAQAKVVSAVQHELQAEIAEDQFFVSSLQRVSYKLLHAPLFEHFVSAVILLNLCLIVYETDLTARGEETPLWVAVCYWSILALFVLESALRLMALRLNFWLAPINVWDLFVVCVDVALSARRLFSTDSGVVGVSAARFLRLLRLARATKALAVFPELRLMMGGLSGAFNSIFWGTVFLFFALIIWGVLAVQLIQPLNLKVAETGAYDGCERCPRAYETVWQAALTFATQIVCGDSWARETVPIIEAFPVTVLFFMGVFLTVGMALLNLILGVVVNAATEARDNIAKEQSDKKALRAFQAKNRLLDICSAMDEDGSGELSRDEIHRGFENNEEFKEKINTLGIHNSDDLECVWTILDTEKTGTVSFEQLVSQIYTMRNSETEYMLAYVKFYVTQIRDKITQSMQGVEYAVERETSRAEEAESNIAGAFLVHKEPAVAAQEFCQVKMPFPNKEYKKQDMNTEDIFQQMKFQGALREVESISANSKIDMALGEQLCPSLLRPSPASLLSQLQVLREQCDYLTSSENLQRSHAAMLEVAIQGVMASMKGSGPPPSDAASWLRQKGASPDSMLLWEV